MNGGEWPVEDPSHTHNRREPLDTHRARRSLFILEHYSLDSMSHTRFPSVPLACLALPTSSAPTAHFDRESRR